MGFGQIIRNKFFWVIVIILTIIFFSILVIYDRNSVSEGIKQGIFIDPANPLIFLIPIIIFSFFITFIFYLICGKEVQMKFIKKLWSKWWFFVPISLILLFILGVLFGLLFNFNPENIAKLILLIWVGIILNRYWWNRKKK